MAELNKKIGNYTITDKTVDQFIAGMPREQQTYAGVPQFRQQIEERLEEICLFAMFGEELKMDETETYAEAMEVSRRDILGQMAMAGLLKDVSVSEEEAKAYFEKNPSEFATEAKAKAKHVLVEEEAKAKEIKEEIVSGAKTFEEAAKAYSTCPSSQRGGDLGTFGKGQMVKEFEEAVFTGELNTVIGPVKTQFGYHLIWVDEVNQGNVPAYDEAKDQIRTKLINKKQQEAYQNKLDELRGKYIK